MTTLAHAPHVESHARGSRAKLAWTIVKETVEDWQDDNASRLAAALAYYTLLSIAPLLVLAVAILGMAFGEEAARGQIAQQISAVVGSQAGESIEAIASSARTPASLDAIWEVKPKSGRGILGVIKDRFFSFAMVLGVAFLLLVSMIFSAAIAALGQFLSGALPGGEALWSVLNFAISLGIITLLFALIFKVIPDAEIRWHDVWVGAAATAVLFTIGKLLVGLYLGKSSFSSSYGAAGSVVALVVWVYYSSQLVFFGAELTQVYARHMGSRIEPSRNAVSTGESSELQRR
jgi:membrane protein